MIYLHRTLIAIIAMPLYIPVAIYWIVTGRFYKRKR